MVNLPAGSQSIIVIQPVSERFATASIFIPPAIGNKKVPLESGSIWKIGRSDSSDIVIADSSVSRNHAIVQRQSDGYYLIDMGSRNGCFVNGSRVGIPVVLKDGDILRFGEHELVFQHNTSRIPVALPASDGDATRAVFAFSLVSILVVDVREFTQLAQQLDKAVLCETIGSWFREGGRIMQRHGSWSQKYIGDAVMSIWVHRNPDEAQRDVIKVLEALVEFENVSSGFQTRFGLPGPFRVGAGINTGHASLGNAGSGDVTDFTAVGDTVNLAFRMETCTKEIGLDIAIGQRTFDLLSACPAAGRYLEQRTVTLKGYEQPTQIWGSDFPALAELAISARALAK